MGSLSFAEIITILLVVLIVFGPNRLPEFARKLGELMAQARRATSQFTKDISAEWGDAVEPMMDVKKDFDGVKQDLKDATAAITGLGAGETADDSPKTSDERSEGDDAPEAAGTTDVGRQAEEAQGTEAEESTGQGADTEMGES